MQSKLILCHICTELHQNIWSVVLWSVKQELWHDPYELGCGSIYSITFPSKSGGKRGQGAGSPAIFMGSVVWLYWLSSICKMEKEKGHSLDIQSSWRNLHSIAWNNNFKNSCKGGGDSVELPSQCFHSFSSNVYKSINNKVTAPAKPPSPCFAGLLIERLDSRVWFQLSSELQNHLLWMKGWF